MKLEDYIDGMNSCPDALLSENYGLSDNWPIFLNYDRGKFLDLLKDSGNYIFTEIYPMADGPVHRFTYPSNLAKLQVFGWVPPFYCQGTDDDKSRQQRDYNMSLMLHTYTANVPSSLSDLKALAFVITDLSNIVINNSIPACFPKSVSWHMHEFKDYSKIVYHEPKLRYIQNFLM